MLNTGLLFLLLNTPKTLLSKQQLSINYCYTMTLRNKFTPRTHHKPLHTLQLCMRYFQHDNGSKLSQQLTNCSCKTHNLIYKVAH